MPELINRDFTVDGLRYHTEHLPNRAGKPFCFFLHGFLGTCADFHHIIEELTDLVNPVLVDLPGHGQTEAPVELRRYQTDSMVADLARLIERFTKEPVFLAGYSMGGRLALHFALQHSDRLAGLVLESAGPGLSDEAERRKRRETDGQRAEAIRKDLAAFVDEWNRMPMFNSPESQNHTDDLTKKLVEVQKSQNPEGIANSLAGFGAGTMPPVDASMLNGIQVPVLLLAGEADEKYVSVQYQLNSQLPDAEVHIIADAAHRVHIDHPGVYIEKIRRFFRNIPDQTQET